MRPLKRSFKQILDQILSDLELITCLIRLKVLHTTNRIPIYKGTVQKYESLFVRISNHKSYDLCVPYGIIYIKYS